MIMRRCPSPVAARTDGLKCDERAAASPLPAVQRSTAEGGRVRGLQSSERAEPPHPTPLPFGEREQTESAVPAACQLSVPCRSPVRRVERDVLGDLALPAVAVREQSLLV